MIGKVTRGSGVQKLLWYLYGPGRANEHTDPHLVGAWTDDLPALEPEQGERGRHDVRPLARLLDQPLAALARQPAKNVWHCSLRLAPEDRALSDAEWGYVAREVLDRVGLAPHTDADGCRWVAVRHAPDHIHLAVTLGRQDGKPARTRNDFYAVGAACRDLEQQYGLRRTAPRDRSGPRLPSRAESEKHHRNGQRETSRDFLRREVRLASATARTTDEFFDRLRGAGLLVRPRYSTQDPTVVTGYSVAQPGDHNAQGQPVWFGGSKLAADLSLNRLRLAWGQLAATGARVPTLCLPPRPPPSRGAIVAQLRWTTSRFRSGFLNESEVQQLRRATITFALVLARCADGSRMSPLVRQVDRLDRLARAPRGHQGLEPAAARVLDQAIGVSEHPSRLHPETMQALQSLLRQLARRGSAEVGGSPPSVATPRQPSQLSEGSRSDSGGGVTIRTELPTGARTQRGRR